MTSLGGLLRNRKKKKKAGFGGLGEGRGDDHAKMATTGGVQVDGKYGRGESSLLVESSRQLMKNDNDWRTEHKMGKDRGSVREKKWEKTESKRTKKRGRDKRK